MSSTIDLLKRNGTAIYPYTVSDAVLDSNGTAIIGNTSLLPDPTKTIVGNIVDVSKKNNTQELTKAQYNALTDAQKKNGTVYYVTDEESGGSSGANNYSTTETKIGTWIDGKPLYRKVIVTTGSGQMKDVMYATTNDVDTLVRFDGIQKRDWEGGYSGVQDNYFVNDSDVFRMYWTISSTHVLNMYVYSGHNLTKFFTIIEYTKSTD